ncbi:RNA polymerase sigma factor [Cocleimonas flava]|uniref:RNA polymerase sigma-70 factor (ECF subfamily) n=1 Tax=Cocleimonas flava TaxID=634765 RepID=A0A4R1ESM3_9GAMM|nr:RNA polymerase sigma factor [Cocleimonas flava]TCJ84576.1 RNA polymerase sigma-70 factor (ECF subfamily) [Cocleimonas flava]
MNTDNDNTFENLEQFLIHSEKRAFIMARVATRDEDVALDIVQDAMIKLVSKYSNKNSHEWPPLFYRIVQSRINDWHRRQKVRNRWRSWLGNDKLSSQGEGFRDSPLENKSNENDQLPEDNTSSFEFSEKVEVAVSALPLRQQQAFMLRAWEEMSTKETANAMKCSEGSVKTHYSRALSSLRASLEEFSL